MFIKWRKLKKYLLAGIAAIAMGLFFGSQIGSAKETDKAAGNIKDKQDVSSFLNQIMEENQKKYDIPASVITVVKDGEIIFEQGYGYGNIEKKEAINPDTSMFRIASTTKLFTWTAVMQLVAEGKIDLDQDINTYLKSLQIPDTFKEPITMRHLMTHTAGFEEGGVGYQITLDEEKLPGSLSDTLKRHMLARVRPPGELPSYSNYGASLAGLIVEEVSGIPYNEYIQKNIFDRLGMAHSTMDEPLPDKFKKDQVLGYKKEGDKFVLGVPTYEAGFRPAGGATVSAGDMAKFMIAHLNEGNYQGHSLLEPAATDLMHKTAYQFHKGMPGLALGFAEGKWNDQREIAHSGSDPLFSTELSLIPDQNLGIFISHSGGNGDEATKTTLTKFFNRYYPAKEAATPVLSADEVGSLDKFGGTYIFTRRNSSHIDKFFSLLVEMKVRVEDGQLVMGSGAEEQRFEPIGDNLFQQIDGPDQLAFRTNEEGKVTAMGFNFMPDMPLVPAKLTERSSFWLPLIGTSLVLFLATLIVSIVNIKKFPKWIMREKVAYSLVNATAGLGILTSVLIVTNVMNMDTLARLSEVTLPVKLILILPIIFSVLTIALIPATFQVWREKYWGIIGRIGYTVIFVAAFVLMAFFKYWHLFGWQFG